MTDAADVMTDAGGPTAGGPLGDGVPEPRNPAP